MHDHPQAQSRQEQTKRRNTDEPALTNLEPQITEPTHRPRGRDHEKFRCSVQFSYFSRPGRLRRCPVYHKPPSQTAKPLPRTNLPDQCADARHVPIIAELSSRLRGFGASRTRCFPLRASPRYVPPRVAVVRGRATRGGFSELAKRLPSVWVPQARTLCFSLLLST